MIITNDIVEPTNSAKPGSIWPPIVGGDGGTDGGTDGGGNPTPKDPVRNLDYFKLLAEWITDYPVGKYLRIENGVPWSFNFNCLFYLEYYYLDNNTYIYPQNIQKIRLSLYEINDKSFNINGVTYDSNTYPALKQVNKKLPYNHFLYNKIADNEGTYTEVCTWIVNNSDNSLDTVILNPNEPLRGYYKKQISFNIDFNLNLTYINQKYTPITLSSTINTNYKNGNQLNINKKYFIKVLPLLDDDNNPDLITNKSTFYIPLNSNEFTKKIDGNYCLFPNNNDQIGIVNYRFSNNYNVSFYRSGEGYLLFNKTNFLKIKNRISSNIGPLGSFGTSYDYIKNPYIIPEIISNSLYNNSYVDPFSKLSERKRPWSIQFDVEYYDYTPQVIDLYYSPLAWFRTPQEYVDKTNVLKTTSYKEWVNPDPMDQGYWYQIWDSWENNQNGISVRNGVMDTLSGITLPVGFNKNNYGGYFDKNLSHYNNSTISYPIHYYFNKTFQKDFNYHFKIRINIIDKLNPINLNQSRLEFITPWKDRINISVEYDTKFNSSQIEYNIFSNINSFSLIDPNQNSSFNTTQFSNWELYINNLSNEYKYSTPNKPIDFVISSSNPKNPLTITANTFFSKDKFSIKSVSIYDTKWNIQGYAAYTKIDSNSDIIILDSSNGWHYFNNKFIYLSKNDFINGQNVNNPFGSDNIDDYFSNKKQDEKYIKYNFISRYIGVQSFNLSFDYTNTDRYLKISLYCGNKLPKSLDNIDELINSEDVIKIGEIDVSNYQKKNSNGVSIEGTKQNCEYVGLDGNQYIFIVAAKHPNASPNFSGHLKIENLKIEGEYHPLNNTLFKSLDDFYKSTDKNFLPSYSIKLGKGNNVNSKANDIYIINSKIGNSNFYSGIWETGVWQSGWRDSEQYYFIDVDQFFSYDNDKIWRFIISGNILVEKYNLNIGDKISISNIVSIDINGDRRLIKNYFTISEISGTSIVVEFVYDFPIKSIEKDSKNHLIVVTKSIWLHGIFLNGRFKGNWIDGIFKGYPFITKMEESHWVDGDFLGGHFKSNIIAYQYDTCDIGTELSKRSDELYAIVKTKEPHNLEIGDSFYLSDQNNKYSDIRESKVLSIKDEYTFFSDFTHDEEINLSKIKYLLTNKNSGLIQNMNFDSYNTSTKTISRSFVSEYIFSYNSWLDLVYDNSSATNIFKPQNIPNNVGGFYSENNLYGYITNDILSSVSKFRDSFSNTIREYKLGTKWKIYHDYIGESSTFDEYFHSIYTPKKTSDLGWSFNVSNNPLIKQPSLSRFIGYRTDDKNEDITGKELKLVAEGDGGLLNLDNKSTTNIPFRYTDKIKSNGYSFISFDLISKDISSTIYKKGVEKKTETQLTWYNGTYSIVTETSKYEPILSFSNVNQTNIIREGKTYNIAMTYLPIYQNINHLETKNKTKIEYFFNKKDLMLSLKGSDVYGSSTASVIIDNLKFYETDMIPFFQYFTILNINKGVQIPNGIEYFRFDYNTSINYNYVSPTSKKTYNYFDEKRFQNTYKIDDSFWIKDNSLNSLDINDFFNRTI